MLVVKSILGLSRMVGMSVELCAKCREKQGLHMIPSELPNDPLLCDNCYDKYKEFIGKKRKI